MSKSVAVFSIVLISGLIACSPSGPDTDPEPYSRSPEEVVEQLAASYNSMDINEFEDCLAPGFNFYFQDMGGSIPDSLWFKPEEVYCTVEIFAQSDSVDLVLITDTVEPWYEDTTMMKVVCTFDLKVIMTQNPLTGYWAQGEAMFITEEISTDVWAVLKWYDYSQTKERTTWSMIKYIFSES